MQKSLFIDVFLNNSTRVDFGSLKFLTTLEALRFKGFPIDGWWIWGIISAFLIGRLVDLTKNKYIYLILPLFCNFLAVILLASPNYPWYWLSMIPFLAGASAIVIGQLIVNPNLLILMTFFILPFSSSFYWGYSVFHQNSGQNINLFRGTLIILILTYLMRKYFGHNKYLHYIWIAVFSLFLFEIFKWNAYSIQYIVAHWNNLPIPSLPNY